MKWSYRTLTLGRWLIPTFFLAAALWSPQAAMKTRSAAVPQREVDLAEDAVRTLPAKSKRYALLIGVDRYVDQQLTPLTGATNDVRELARALTAYAGFEEDQIILLTSDDPDEEKRPTRINIISKLSNLKKAVPRDGLLLFAFSGHGIERNGQAWLLPSDARVGNDIDLLEQSAINITDMKERIRATGVGQVMVIMDACRNNPEAGKGNADNPLSNAYRKFDFNVRNREVEAFVTFYATDLGKRAYEYKQRRQGYFTWALVEALKGGAANSRGEVTLGSLIGYVQEKVPKKVALDLGKEQRPLVDVRGYRANDLVVAVAAAGGSAPSGPPKQFTNQSGMEFVLVPAGSFEMGSTKADEDRWNGILTKYNQTTNYGDERPRHPVTIRRAYYLGKYEVTIGEYLKFCRETNTHWPHWLEAGSRYHIRTGSDEYYKPFVSESETDRRPVVGVSWNDAKAYCEWLSKREGMEYRLPSEAEWEYACRAGTVGDYAGDLDEMGWHGNNSGKALIDSYEVWKKSGNDWTTYWNKYLKPNGNRTHPVGEKKGNPWGLHDMHGNVWEWCGDWYDERYYQTGPAEDPKGPETGEFRVLRGGSWDDYSHVCRSAYRGYGTPDGRDSRDGFRVMIAPRTQE